jgi:hypothetical protein
VVEFTPNDLQRGEQQKSTGKSFYYFFHHITLLRIIQDICLLGQIEHGIYHTSRDRDMATVDMVHNVEHSEHCEHEELANVAKQVSQEQMSNTHYEAINTSSSSSLFKDASGEEMFFSMPTQVIQKRVIPIGYGVLPEEWDDGSYPSCEEMRVGRKHQKIHILLVDRKWLEQAKLWAQGLKVLTCFREGEIGGDVGNN